MLTRLRRDDTGVAMVLVVALSAIVLLVAALALTKSVNAGQRSRTDERWVGALPAAQAGAEDYLHRLNENNNYFLKENADSSNSALSDWVDVPGSSAGGNRRYQFRYRVDSTAAETQNSGAIRLRVAGRVSDGARSEVRTIEVTYRKRGYLDYLYYTDKETFDPARYPDPQAAAGACDKYYPDRQSWCRDIQFRTGDVLDGPVGSNDAFLMSGTPTFTDVVTTGWNDPKKNYYRAASGNYTVDRPSFAKGLPQVRPSYEFPPQNTEIKKEADFGTGGKGCLYTGPTLITLVADGKMQVTSPYTRKTGANCGSDFDSWKTAPIPDPAMAKKVDVDLPANGVIYVQGVPTASSDPNYPDTAVSCPSPLLDGKYPDKNEHALGENYDCRSGDAWVYGSLRGQLTIAAAKDIVIVDNLDYDKSRSDNVLGLVAAQNVKIYHPVSKDGTRNLTGTRNDITVEAAIFALQHSFGVQNHDLGEKLGTLMVNGAIIQRYRGPVGTSGGTTHRTGYLKDYHYDKRLQYLQPPYFLNPVATSWSQRLFKECKNVAIDSGRDCDAS